MKRKIVIIISIMALALPVLMSFSACDGCSAAIDWNEFSIANYSSYTAIAAASVDDSLEATAKSTKSDNFIVAKAASSECKLVGQKEDGTFEVIELQDSEGNKHKQNISLHGMKAFDKFTFLYYAKHDDCHRGFFNLDMQYGLANYEKLNNKNSGYHPNCSGKNAGYYYILDNETGKVFDVYEMLLNILPKEVRESRGTIQSYMECESAAYVEVNFHPQDTTPDSESSGFFRMEIENDTLKLTKVLSMKKMQDFLGTGSYSSPIGSVVLDKYGNIFSNIQGSYYITNENAPYVLKKDGSIASLKDYKQSGKLFMAINNLVYYVTDTETKVFNENGDLVDSAFTPPTEYYMCKYTTMTDDPAYKVDNVSYYYGMDTFVRGVDTYENDKYIHKFTFNGDEFEYERIELEDKSDKYVLTNNRIYFLNNDEIFYCSLDTGKKTALVSDYTFKSISKDYNGNLLFTGLTDSLDDVSGIITPDDEVEVTIDEYIQPVQVIYIKPLN